MPTPSMNIPMKISVKPMSPKLQRAMRSTALQIMFHGPRFTSKSYTIFKMFCFYHEMIPELQSFIVRNEAKTLAKTVVKTLLRMCRHPAARHKKNPFEIVGGLNFPQRILWDNGGVTELGGLDDPDKILGGDYHMGWYNEVQRESKEESVSNLLGCFVGKRAGPLPSWVPWRYRMYFDGNPTNPNHFIYRRKKEGSIEWYNILHQDNPLLSKWDPDGNFLGLNQRGLENEEDLLIAYPPGYMRDRMVYGIPRGAEGMVYPMYDPKIHVEKIDRNHEIFKNDGKTTWRWSVDIGGRDPHAIGIFAQRGFKHYLYKEIIRSQVKISDVIEMAEKIHRRDNIPKPAAVFIDWNVKDFDMQLLEKGYPVLLADKDVATGVEIHKEMLANRDFVVNDYSLEERDILLGSEPQGYKEEVFSYVHKPPEKRSGTTKDDLPDPTNRNKHSMDFTRYYGKGTYLASEGYDINYSQGYGARDETRIFSVESTLEDTLLPEGGEYFETF